MSHWQMKDKSFHVFVSSECFIKVIRHENDGFHDFLAHVTCTNTPRVYKRKFMRMELARFCKVLSHVFGKHRRT